VINVKWQVQQCLVMIAKVIITVPHVTKGKRATHGLDSPPKSHVVSAPEPILPNPGTNNITSTVDGALFQDELQQIVQESVERKKPLYETAARLTVDGLEKKRKLSDEEYLRSCAVKRGGNKQYTLSKFGEDFGKSTKQFEILSEKMIEFMQSCHRITKIYHQEKMLTQNYF